MLVATLTVLNHLGYGSLGLPVRDYLDYVNWCERIHHSCGQDHSLGRESWTVYGGKTNRILACIHSLHSDCGPTVSSCFKLQLP